MCLANIYFHFELWPSTYKDRIETKLRVKRTEEVN